MEQCIHQHIFNYLKLKKIISSFQSGLQRGDATTNQLVYLYNKFLNALDERKEIRLVFCNISKALNKIWHKALIFKFKSTDISGDILYWFTNYLGNGRQCVCMKLYITLVENSCRRFLGIYFRPIIVFDFHK